MFQQALRGVMTVTIVCCAGAAAEPAWSYSAGGWSIGADSEGHIVGLQDAHHREWIVPERAPSGFLPELRLYTRDGKPVAATPGPTSMRIESGGVTYVVEYSGEAVFRFEYAIELTTSGSWPVLKRSIAVVPETFPFEPQIELRMAFNFLAATDVRSAFIPRQDGIGEQFSLERAGCWEFPMCAPIPNSPLEQASQLAIPMFSMLSQKANRRITTTVDPFGGVLFSLDGPSSEGAVVFQTGALPMQKPFRRTVWSVFHDGGEEEAIAAWYATALRDIPPGPEWLHNVAWQHYDYLSHGGKGWFEDIDAVKQSVQEVDRGKIVFALHGWYDLLGRYTFDSESGRLDDSWTAFPNAVAMKGKGFPTSEPVPFTKDEMHRRIRYAKDRGLRVALYFADGLTACEGANRYAEDRVLSWGGWNGPDTVGKPYTQDPSNPGVYGWYLAYHKALLAEYGSEIDAFVWDETFMIRAATAKQTYLAPVMMRLVRDLTLATTAYRKDLAFLVSDCIGGTSDDRTRWLDVPPYAIMAHGCYQDSHSRPSVWPYGIFPNYRNVLWSCNWRAVEHWGWTEFGVRHYGTPLATSNGWLDDQGFAHLSDAGRKAVLDLFARRKDRPQQLHWITGPAPEYSEKM